MILIMILMMTLTMINDDTDSVVVERLQTVRIRPKAVRKWSSKPPHKQQKTSKITFRPQRRAAAALEEPVGGPWVARGYPAGARGSLWVARGRPVGVFKQQIMFEVSTNYLKNSNNKKNNSFSSEIHETQNSL